MRSGLREAFAALLSLSLSLLFACFRFLRVALVAGVRRLRV
jgi:hypothetical protein